MTYKADERIYETSITTGTGTYTLDGAVTDYQPVSTIGANNYGPFFVTNDPGGTGWEAIIGQYLAGPARLVRTHVMASSNAGAAVDWAAGTRKIRCGWPAWLALPRRTTKSVAGAADVTLTQSEMRCNHLELTGALTGNISVIVDDTKWDWIVHNNTTGAFTLTFKVAGQTGVKVPQKRAMLLHNNSTDVVRPGDSAAVETRTANTILGVTDHGKTIRISSGTFSQTFDAVATLGDGWEVDYRIESGATVTFDPNGAETFDGAATVVVAGPASLRIKCNGAALYSVAIEQPASDTVAGKIRVATESDMEGMSSTVVAVSPGRQHRHKSAVKAWASWNDAGSLASQTYGATSVTDTGIGNWTLNLSITLSHSDTTAIAACGDNGGRIPSVGGRTGSTVQVLVRDVAAALADSGYQACSVFGDI